MADSKKLVSTLGKAAADISKRNLAKARVVYQIHKTKELAKSRNPNRKLIDKEFDELHATIVNLVRHEKQVAKRQEEDEALVKALKEQIFLLEERVHNSEKLLRSVLDNSKKIQDIDDSLVSLYKKVVMAFDLKEASHDMPKQSKAKELKQKMAELEKAFYKLKGREKDTTKLELIENKIELLKARLK